MRKRFFVTIMTIFLTGLCWGQSVIVGRLVDATTKKPISLDLGYSASLMDRDTIGYPNMIPVVYEKLDGQSKSATFVEVKIHRRGAYILWVFLKGYEPLFFDFEISKKDRGRKIDVGTLFLTRDHREKVHELGEAIVVAPKLKFYFDKDTLVYNATSYLQQAGAKLGSVLSQMPGLEIKPDGEILASGKRVDVLLFNGKDFFNKDRVTLLANLPAYVVKQIKVYEQKTQLTEGFERERLRRGRILDIILKPDYSASNFGNVDLGYGTDKHYYAKLFGMTYSRYHRVSGYGITNDINRNEMLQLDGTAQNIDDGLGEKKHHKMGLNYNYDDYKKRFSVSGGIEMLWSNTYRTIQSKTQRFLSQGENYSYNDNVYKPKSFAFQTRHEINPFANTSYSFVVKPTFSYKYSKELGESFSAMTDEDVQVIDVNWLDSLKQQRYSQLLDRYGVNRSLYKAKTIGEMMTSGVVLSKHNLLRDEVGNWSIEGSWNWYKHNNNDYNQRKVDYIKQNVLNSWQNQYTKDRAERNQLALSSTYALALTRHNALNIGYAFEYVGYDANHALFALDALSGWQSVDNPVLGMLPSYNEMLSVIDGQNSYDYFEKQTQHKISLGYTYEYQRTGIPFPIKFNVTFPFAFENKSLDFSQLGKKEYVQRHYLKPSVKIDFSCYTKHNAYIMFGYDYVVNSPTMYNLVNIVNTSNPLIQMRGNDALNVQRSHTFIGQYFIQKKINSHSFAFSGNVLQDKIAMTSLYDPKNGQTIFTPENIDGNYSLGFNVRNNIFLNQMGMSSIGNNLSLDFAQNVDYQIFVDENIARKSRVLNRIIKEEFSYNQSLWKQKVKFSLSAYCNYLHATSNREDYQRINTYDYGLKLVVNTHLPWSLLLSTDLTSVSRRGYNYAQMNDDQYIWNMRLTKAFGERIQLQLEVNDILKQRKNIFYLQNAQGRVEEIYNNMRRYAMLHFIWNIGKVACH